MKAKKLQMMKERIEKNKQLAADAALEKAKKQEEEKNKPVAPKPPAEP